MSSLRVLLDVVVHPERLEHPVGAAASHLAQFDVLDRTGARASKASGLGQRTRRPVFIARATYESKALPYGNGFVSPTLDQAALG
jgi:hypothetical protein